ncbi:hypothetical protein JCM6882_004280 [Rhodosporidiobolus microsporus]
MAHPGTTPSTTTSTSTASHPFPPLSPALFARLTSILDHCPPSAHSWSDLTRARQQAQQQQGRTGAAGEDDEEEDDDVYPLLLRLTWQDGTTWHAKWASALAASGQGLPLDAAGQASRAARDERRPPHTNHHRSHRRARRPSDDLDFLKHKLAAVDLSSHPSAPPPPRRAPSTPLDAPRPSSSSRLPPPTRPRSTPPLAAASTTRPRALLVKPGDGGQGYSSADEWVGVPRAAERRKTEEKKRVEEQQEQRHEERTPRRSTAVAADGGPLTSTPRAGAAPPAPPAPTQTLAPATATAARHPLLERRLAELSLSQPSPSPSPATRLAAPRPLPVDSSPAAPSISSSFPFLIAGQFSPPKAHALALSFSRLRTLGGAFDAWVGKAEWVREREREVRGRRGEWEGRGALRGWRERVRRVGEMGERAERWREEREKERERGEGKRLVRGAFGRWREKRAEREREREEERRRGERELREARLREARDRVVELRRRGVVRKGMEHWYLLLLSRRAASFRRRSLLTRSLSHLLSAFSFRTAHTAALTAAADERWAENEAARGRSALGEWGRRARVRGVERELVEGREGERKRSAWEAWRDKLQQKRYVRDLEAAADQHYAISLASSAIETWTRRKRRVDDLSHLALSTSTSFLRARLTSSLLPHWRLSTRLSLSLSSSSRSVLLRAFNHWEENLDHVQVELAGRADAFAARKDGELVGAALAAWGDAAAHHARLNQAAAAVARRSLLARWFARWEGRKRAEDLQERKADVVRGFMAQRGAWRVWVEKGAERRRGRWVEGKRRERGREALMFWLQQTRQKQQDRQLVLAVQQRSNTRLLSSSLSRWKNRLIALRDVDAAASELYDGRVLHAGFKRWADETVQAAERLLVADAHRAGKLEDLHLRLFTRWRHSTARSVSLKARLAAFAAAKAERTREDAWGVWRERAMRRREEAVRARREKAVKGEVVGRWMMKSKALLAHRHHRSHLLSSSLSLWRAWTPPPDLLATAVEVDRNVVLGGAVKVWRVRGEARRMLRGVSRLRPFGSSPASSPTVAPPHRSSPSPGPSPSSSILLASSAHATPTPSLPRTRPPLTRPNLPSASPAPAPASSSFSAASSSLSRTHSRSKSILSSTSPSTLLTTTSASASASASSSSRPRLSAEYSSLPSLQPRPPSRSSRTRSRSRSRSISSLRSVQTSRSAPAGGAVFDSEEEDDEEAEEEQRDEGPSVGGGGLLSLSLSRARGARPSSFSASASASPHLARRARTEDGETSGSRGAGGGGKDVRGEYAALRTRLREAAVRARTGGER